jgi:hypothetical protein
VAITQHPTLGKSNLSVGYDMMGYAEGPIIKVESPL